ncbi:hypothetical protein BZG36_02252 [Bifiguratus adelaidae]|uniref:Cytochrome c oxidase assembly factor 6 n=1 Tax=Bifiguratus adelaidae TaxID=1938954 RepID=A0A261Y1W5_9FUNG|nr:hypothetical protein BZG36_02252 [Bifiguratus adelaidae]
MPTPNDPSSATPPTRAQRQQCWKARDAYFDCLTECGIVDPNGMDHKPEVQEKGSKCLALKKEYEKDCIASWVEYFNKRRVLEVQQAKYLKLAKEQSGK